MAVSVTKVWPVEKYARFVSGVSQPSTSLQELGKKSGAWQHYSSKDGVIQMALLESNHLMVSSGNQIYESFSLWETKKWIKGVTKGDSILFLYRLKDENRKFRVKFSSSDATSSPVETCRNCIATLAHLVPIREMAMPLSGSSTGSDTATGSLSDSQIPYCEDSQFGSQLTQEATLPPEPTVAPGMASIGRELSMQGGPPTGSSSAMTEAQQHAGVSSIGSLQPRQSAVAMAVGRKPNGGDGCVPDSEMMPVPDIAKAILSESKSLGRAYAETNFPTEQLGAFIRLCLTDSNFPAFVEAVEKELSSITTEM